MSSELLLRAPVLVDVLLGMFSARLSPTFTHVLMRTFVAGAWWRLQPPTDGEVKLFPKVAAFQTLIPALT